MPREILINVSFIDGFDVSGLRMFMPRRCDSV